MTNEQINKIFEDDFNKPKLRPEWLTLRDSLKENLIVNLDSKKSQLNTGCFGIVSLIDAENHIALIVKQEDNRYNVYLDQQVFDLNIKQKIGELTAKPKVFELVNTKAFKRFSVTDEIGKELIFTTMPSIFLIKQLQL